jgi:hypothetical protein
MNDRQVHADEKSELLEYLEAAKEIEAARALEEAEFIRERGDGEDEVDESAGQETQDEPAHLIHDAGARRSYWQAQGLVELEQTDFAAALEQGHVPHQRSAYFRLAAYHGRTISILRSALAAGKEPLAQAAMRNLATLHRAMMQMHNKAPHNVPVALVLDRDGRDDLARDLVVRALQESAEPLELDSVMQRANDLDVIDVARGTVQRHLKDMAASGYVQTVSQRPTRYARTQRAYTGMDANALSLRALVGADIYARLEDAGYGGLSDVTGRQSSFRELFGQVTGLSQASAALFADLVETLQEGRVPETSPWSFTDLIGSPYPRPYQYEAYAVFRGYGYHGQLVEAPTGSGKTFIGMMCIQDWLKNLTPGQSILVLVPTSNYLQQWSGELCYKPIGLRLSPEMVFAGTPNQLERFKKRTGSHPAVLLTTYTALSQAGSAIGKGGFDIDSIEMFLQGANVQYVVLDEVHKVAENLKSVSSNVIRLMLEWLHDGSVRGLIGFTGTAEAYRSRFAKLGLQLVYSIPIDELIAAGFVAPFAELGAPFAYSARERRIRAGPLQGPYQCLHGPGGRQPASRLVRPNSPGRARGHRPRTPEHVPGPQGLAVDSAEAPGRLGVGREPAAHRGESRDHGADRPSLDRRRHGARSGRQPGCLPATRGRDQRCPRAVGRTDLPAFDFEAAADAWIHDQVRRRGDAPGL